MFLSYLGQTDKNIKEGFSRNTFVTQRPVNQSINQSMILLFFDYPIQSTCFTFATILTCSWLFNINPSSNIVFVLQY